MPQGIVRRQWAATWPMLMLCLLASSRWLVESAWPEAQSTDLTEAAGCLLAAGAFALLLSTRQRSRVPSGWSGTSRGTLGGGLAILTGPVLAASISSRYVNADDATLALSLVPVVIAVASPALGSAGSEDLTARLWPGLAGIAGLLLLLPQPSLSGWRFDLALPSMPLFVGTGAVLATRQSRRLTPSDAARARMIPWQVSAPALASFILGGLGFYAGHAAGRLAFSVAAAALDGCLAALTLVVVGRLGPLRWSAQFLLIPVLTLLEGAVLLHPLLDLRSWFGFALLIVSGGYLLFVGGERE